MDFSALRHPDYDPRRWWTLRFGSAANANISKLLEALEVADTQIAPTLLKGLKTDLESFPGHPVQLTKNEVMCLWYMTVQVDEELLRRRIAYQLAFTSIEHSALEPEDGNALYAKLLANISTPLHQILPFSADTGPGGVYSTLVLADLAEEFLPDFRLFTSLDQSATETSILQAIDRGKGSVVQIQTQIGPSISTRFKHVDSKAEWNKVRLKAATDPFRRR